MENWLRQNDAVDYEEHIQFLRDLQKLRSSGMGHRKGKSYAKISKLFGLDKQNKIDVMEEIFKRANAFLIYLNERILR